MNDVTILTENGFEDLYKVKGNKIDTYGLCFEDDIPALEEKLLIPKRLLGYNVYYKEFAEKLKPHINHPEFGYLFEVAKTLCELLEYKYTLGVRTREGYKNGNVKEVIERYKKCEELLPNFYQAMKNRWNIEEKPFGFEVIDVRLGGLKQRLIHCREVLEQFDKGEITRIEELEVEIVPTGKSSQNNEWMHLFTPGYVEKI